MTAAEIQVRTASGSADRVAQVRRQWDEGQAADARAYLDQHPEVAADRNFVFELAFEEYRYRAEKGEAPAIDSFAARFPICRSTLAQMLLVDQWVEQEADDSRPAWPQPGQSLLGFHLVRELGRGSFARVYLASETALGNRPVALKVSRRGAAEADILGRLRHDNIVPVYSIQEDPLSGMTVVCMPYLGTTTLCGVLDHAFASQTPCRAEVILEAATVCLEEAELLGPGKCSTTFLHGSYVEGVVELCIQLADALAFVHERKIYHRDLKPSNVLVRPDGRPMLLDFNLSFDEQAANQPIGGTPMYMSPEHLRAIDPEEKGPCLVDGRSDLYSLGVILYELLTGRHPFGPIPEKADALTVVRALRKRQEAGFQPVDLFNPEVPRRLSRIVARCLASHPRERFSSAGELAGVLRECLQARRRLTRTRVLVGMAAAVLVGASVLTAVFAFRQPYPERQFQQGMQAFQAGQYFQAVGFFNRALDEEDSVKGRLARSRAHQAMEDWQAALADLRHADKLEPSGQVKAMLAYCCSKHQPPNWDAAIGYYKDAIKAGAGSAIVHNNLGYCLMMRGRGGSAEASENFARAVQLDPKFQLAHYQRALVDLKAGDARKITREGLDAMRKVFEVGPANGQLHLDAARLYALAEFQELRWKELALSHLEKALRRGIDARQVERDYRFKSLVADEAFQRLLRSATSQVNDPLPVIQRNPDPFPDLGA